MIVEHNDEHKVPAGGVPIVDAVVRMDVDFVDTCKAFVHTILSGSDSADDSTGLFFLFFHVAFYGTGFQTRI